MLQINNIYVIVACVCVAVIALVCVYLYKSIDIFTLKFWYVTRQSLYREASIAPSKQTLGRIWLWDFLCVPLLWKLIHNGQVFYHDYPLNQWRSILHG